MNNLFCCVKENQTPPIYSSHNFFIFLSNFQISKTFISLFSGTEKPTKLKLGPHMDSALVYHVYLNQAAGAYPFIIPPAFMPRGYSFCLSVRMFVRSFILPFRSWNYFKVLRYNFSSVVYLSNHSSESIHIWTIDTLEGRLLFHDSWPQGPCPRVGLEVKI